MEDIENNNEYNEIRDSDNNETCTTKSILNLLWGMLNVLVGVYAIYLSFQRSGGFDFGSFLAALCCSWCYVAYALAVPIKTATNNVNVF